MFEINVDKEIATYLKKKDALLKRLVDRLNTKANNLARSIADAGKVIRDLSKKKDKESIEIRDITLKIQQLREEK
jgi:hypothetical protein